MIELGFRQLLATAPALAALRGDRVSILNLNDGEGLPAQVLHVIGSPQDPSLDDDGPQRMRMQIDHWAEDALGSLLLREATRQFLRGVSNQTLSDGTVLQWAEYIGPMDFYDNDAGAFRCASEFYLHFNFPA